MNQDLEEAVRIALEPMTPHGGWELCPQCGATKPILGEEHVCRSLLLDLPGVAVHDGKHRARTYAIE